MPLRHAGVLDADGAVVGLAMPEQVDKMSDASSVASSVRWTLVLVLVGRRSCEQSRRRVTSAGRAVNEALEMASRAMLT